MDETNCFVGSNGRTSKRQAFFLFLECSTDGSGGWIPYETMDDLAELYKHLNRSDTEADVNAEFCAVLLNTFSQLQVNLDSPRADVVPLRSIISAAASESITPKPGPQVQAILRANFVGLARLFGSDRWEAMQWPKQLEKAFTSGSAHDVSRLLQQVEQALANIVQEGRPEWCGLPIGWILRANKWIECANDTKTFAQLCGVISTFLHMVQPLLTAYYREAESEGRATFVPTIGKSYRLVGAYQKVCQCLDIKDTSVMPRLDKDVEQNVLSTVSKVTIRGIRYCSDAKADVAVEVMVVPCANNYDSSCFVCGCYSEPLVKCRGMDCCRAACAKCSAAKHSRLNKRLRVGARKPRYWSCPQCDCNKDPDPQSQLNFHFREALRRAGPYDAITMRTIMRRIAASKYDDVHAFFEDLKAFAMDSSGRCTESRLDVVHPVQQYLFENFALLMKVEDELQEWDGNAEPGAKKQGVLKGANGSLSAVVACVDNESEIASERDSVAIEAPAVSSKLRSLARVNYNQENYFDSILEEDEVIAQMIDDDKSNGKNDGDKDWRLSESGRWIKLFAKGPNALISTKMLETMVEDPMRNYIEQRQFTCFLQQYADIFKQRSSLCNGFAAKSRAVGEFLSVRCALRAEWG